MIHIRLLLGDIPSDRLEKLADVVERHGEKVLRSTQEQNLVLRGLRKAEMEFLYAELEEIQLAEPAPALFRNLTPCIGAGTCRLGVCDSRRLARKIEESLAASGLNLTDLGNLRIRISGCPNGCSRHAVADIGLNGVLRKVDGKSVPHYVVHLGGGLGEGGVTLAEPGPTVPEERIPQFITALLHAYALAEVAPDFRRFLEQGGRKEAERLATEVPSLAELSYHI